LFSCSTYKTNEFNIEDIVIIDNHNFIKLDTTKLEQNAKKFVISGSILQQKGEYAESILDFWEALKYDSSSSIYYAIAKSYVNLYRYDAAIYNLKEAIKKNPNFIYAYELLAEIYDNIFDFENAIKIYKKIVELRSTYENKLKLAKAYMSNFQDSVAIELYKELLSLRKEPEVLFKLIDYYEMKNDTSETNKYYQIVFDILEKNLNTFEFLIQNYIDNNEYQKALDLLDSIKNSLLPNEIIYLFDYVGIALLKDAENDTIPKSLIVDYLSKLDQRFYFDSRINIIAGYLSFKINDTSLTETYFKRAVSVDTNSQIPLTIAYFYYDNKLTEKAIQTIESSYPKHQTNSSFPLALAYFYFQKSDLSQSLNYATQAYRLDSNKIEIMAHLGLIYDNLNKYDSCDYFYEKILKIDPENPMINNNYAYSLAVRGEQLNQAINMSKKSLNIEPNNPTYLDTYGWIQYKLGNYEEAEKYLLEALNYDETNYELYEHLGFLYLKLNNSEKALEYFTKSLELNDNNSKVKNEIMKINK